MLLSAILVLFIGTFRANQQSSQTEIEVPMRSAADPKISASKWG